MAARCESLKVAPAGGGRGKILLGEFGCFVKSGVDLGRFFVNDINIGKSLGVFDLGIGVVDKSKVGRFLLGVFGCG